MLDSDIPNPDSRLFVEFYSKPIQNNFRTALEGRPIFDDIDMVKIYVPGDPTTIIDTPARDEHKARFPRHWAHYQNINEKGPDAGTQLSAWAILTKAQVEELRALKFFTVESIATASDAQLQRIGMIAGMSPTAFRERANRYLKAASDDGAFNQQADETKKLAAQNQELMLQMQAMQTQMAELAANQKLKPGRKPQAESSEVNENASHAA